jgi:predicted RND superfamily exporter protein
MIPNTLPVLVVFGGMGWLGIPVDIGSMMAASIALGVAVDDTIHFLAWYRDDLKSLGNRHEAVLASYRRSANATLQAGLINGLGLSVFATSSFTPTQRFGWLMLTILIAGITAELIMLPALLFSPAGKVFSTKGQPTKDGRKGAASKPHFVLSPLDRRRALREYVPVEA